MTDLRLSKRPCRDSLYRMEVFVHIGQELLPDNQVIRDMMSGHYFMFGVQYLLSRFYSTIILIPCIHVICAK